MKAPRARHRAILLFLLVIASVPGPAAGKTASSSPMLPGANSKEPISIEADKLNYFDKEQKAVYTGNVVVIQGDSKLTCSVMTIFLAKSASQSSAPAPVPAPTPAPAASATATPGGTQVSHMDAAGPVTLISKTQVATGGRGAYDKEQNKVWLFDNVTLSDGGNVTKGDKLTYNLTTGEAFVEGQGQGRVRGQFEQGSAGGGLGDSDKAASKKAMAPSTSDKPKAVKKPAAGEAAPKS
jgi:lipopolysaccharide export system protein LptA